MSYSKALSTYKRINKIKQHTDKISEAQVMIGEQRAKAISKAKDLQARKQMAGAVSNAISTAAAFGMSQSDKIDPKDAEKISAGIGVLGEVGTSLVATKGKMPNDVFLGLSSDEYAQLSEQVQPDIASGAIQGYALQESLNEIRRRKDFDKAKPGLENNQFGYSVEEMAPYMDQVGFQKGKGYDFSQLPLITRQRLRNIEVQRGLVKDPLRADDDVPFDLMDSLNYIKTAKTNNQFA